MKKVIFIFLVAACARADQRAQGNCELGGAVVVTNSVPSTTVVQQSFPSCTITVYLNGTLTLATIYSDNNGTPQANPFTADSKGRWAFYAANGRYDIQLSGAGIPSPFTLGDVFLSDGVSSGVGPPANPCSNGSIYTQTDATSFQIWFCNGTTWTQTSGTSNPSNLPGQAGNDFKATVSSGAHTNDTMTVSAGNTIFGINLVTQAQCQYTVSAGNGVGTYYIYETSAGAQVMQYSSGAGLTLTVTGTNCSGLSAASPAWPTNQYIRPIANGTISTGTTVSQWGSPTQYPSLQTGWFVNCVAGDLTCTLANGTITIDTGANIMTNSGTNVMLGGSLDTSGASLFAIPQGAVDPAACTKTGQLFFNTTSGLLKGSTVSGNPCTWTSFGISGSGNVTTGVTLTSPYPVVGGGGNAIGVMTSSGAVVPYFWDYVGQAPPANPGAGNCREFFNNVTGHLQGINSAGGDCTPQNAAAVLNNQTNTYTTGTQDLTNATALVVPNSPGFAPTTAGSVGYDTTQQAPVSGDSTGVTFTGWRVLKSCTQVYTSTATDQITAAASSGSYIAFTTTCTLPANLITTGKIIRVYDQYSITTPGSGVPALDLQLYLGSTQMTAFGNTFVPTVSLSGAGGSMIWEIKGTASPGASVQVMGNMDAIPYFPGATSSNFLNLSQPRTGLATNGSLIISRKARWGSNVANTSLSLMSTYVEVGN